jgi:hypothetical protein
MRLESVLYEMFNNLTRYLKAQPINLGGYTASGGGAGGPPGGFIGYLPQTRIAYDLSEEMSIDTPASGASLLDNLNHIRYRLENVEGSGSTGIIIKSDDVIVASGIHYLDFQNFFAVTEESAAEVAVSLLASGVQSDATYSGVFGEDLSSYINGIETHFDLAGVIHDNSLAVYLNGIRQLDSNYALDEDYQGFTTDFIPISGDTLLVDYVEAYAGYFHTHSQYAPASGTLTIVEILELLDDKADVDHTHVMTDITDLSIDAESIQGIPVADELPDTNQVLMFTTISGEYTPTSIPVHQQIVFTIASSGAFTVGTKPLRVYAHDVGNNAEISEIFVCFNTPPVTEVRMNVLKNSNTIFNVPAYVSIPSGSYTASKTTGFLDDTFEKDDYFQIRVENGDDVACDMTLHIRFTYEI